MRVKYLLEPIDRKSRVISRDNLPERDLLDIKECVHDLEHLACSGCGNCQRLAKAALEIPEGQVLVEMSKNGSIEHITAVM